MSGTVTGKKANIWIAAHSGGASLATIATDLTDGEHDHTSFGIGDFTLTLDKGTVEAPLVGQTGNYKDQGSLSVDGSLTSIQFATSGTSDMLLNLVDDCSAGSWKYLAIS